MRRWMIQEMVIHCWLMDLKHAMYGSVGIIHRCGIDGERRRRMLDDLLFSASTASSVCCLLPVFYFFEVKFLHETGSRIRSMNGRLEKIYKKGSEFQLMPLVEDDPVRVVGIISQISPIDEGIVIGLTIEGDDRSLFMFLTRKGKWTKPLIAIIGLGGIGKLLVNPMVFVK